MTNTVTISPSSKVNFPLHVIHSKWFVRLLSMLPRVGMVSATYLNRAKNYHKSIDFSVKLVFTAMAGFPFHVSWI